MANTPTQLTSFAASGNWTEKWQSVYSFEKVPQVWKEYITTYGLLWDIRDMCDMFGKIIDLRGRSLRVFALYPYDKQFTLADLGAGVGIATGSAGADITFQLTAADYDANNKTILRKSDVVLIPSKIGSTPYMTNTTIDYAYRIMSFTGTGASTTYTAKPFLKDNTTFAPAHITTAIPAGTQISIMGDAHAPASPGIAGLTDGSFYYDFHTAITRSKMSIDGGMVSQENYLDAPLRNGKGRGILNRALLQMEFDHTRKENYKYWTGQDMDNTTMTEVTANINGDTNNIIETRGLLPWCNLLAQQYTYNDNFEIANLDDLPQYFLSQGVLNQDNLVMCGDLFFKDWENAGYSFIQQYGHDKVMKSMNEVGLNFKAVEKGSYRYIAKESGNLSDPKGFGSATYGDRYRKMAICIPMGENQVTVEGANTPSGKVKISNLMLGVQNYNGENRLRKIYYLRGPSGLELPGEIVHEDDLDMAGILSESMLVVTKVNQFIQINGN